MATKEPTKYGLNTKATNTPTDTPSPEKPSYDTDKMDQFLPQVLAQWQVNVDQRLSQLKQHVNWLQATSQQQSAALQQLAHEVQQLLERLDPRAPLNLLPQP